MAPEKIDDPAPELSDLGVPDPEEPLCDQCQASFRREGDTLCPACRADVDEAYGDLPV